MPSAELVAAFKNSRALGPCETPPLAEALLHAGIPAVIGTHEPIADEAAKLPFIAVSPSGNPCKRHLRRRRKF